jgi:hypothetical protein
MLKSGSLAGVSPISASTINSARVTSTAHQLAQAFISRIERAHVAISLAKLATCRHLTAMPDALHLRRRRLGEQAIERAARRCGRPALTFGLVLAPAMWLRQ